MHKYVDSNKVFHPADVAGFNLITISIKIATKSPRKMIFFLKRNVWRE